MSEQINETTEANAHLEEIDRECARFEGDYIESADLMSTGPVRLSIADVVPPNVEKAADGRLIDKPILLLKGARKKFILGKTNERVLKAMFGRKPSGWIGQTITLGVRYLKAAFGQNNVPTVRVIPPDDVAIPHGAWKHFGREQPWK